MKTASEQTTLRYLLVLKDLKKQIDKNPKTRIKAFMRSKKVNDRLTTYVIKSGIVKNNGCPKYPNWEWVSIEPNIHMVKKIRGMILDENRDYNKRVRGVNKLPKECFDKPTKHVQNYQVSIDENSIIEIQKEIIRERKKNKSVSKPKCEVKKTKTKTTSILWGLIKITKTI
jgi:hypothetical protein